MSTIKKPFVEIHSLLKQNQGKKIKDLMPQLLEIMTSQQRDKNHREDEHGLWIFCYYHKEWELTSQVEYGSKVNTATGLNTMCKVGVNQWTKQQREFKQKRADLLTLVADGKLDPADINSKIEELDEERKSIKPLIEHHWEEALKDLRQQEDSEAS